jgi:hypothetical protein
MADQPLPLMPLPEDGPAIKQALATFSLSAFLGAGTLLFLLPMTMTSGASRAARLRRVDARQECLEAEKLCQGGSEGSTASR